MRLRGDLEMLDIHRSTAFTFDDRGRMIHESAPDRSLGRRFSVTGCREGNLAVVRADVPDPTAGELQRIVATEPPLAEADAVPVHLEAYREVLGFEGATVPYHHGLLWVFPEMLTYPSEADLVWSGTAEAERFMARFGEAVPASLVEKGFRTIEDLWEPWCVAMVGGQVASIAETVRSGGAGAEVGVDTAVGYRGRGLGAAVSAGWSRHPELAGLVLFYSTDRENWSSRHVTERIGLRLLGSTFAIP